MSSRDLTIGMIFLSQTLIGILGNFSLLYHYIVLYFTGCRLRSTDLILRHLTVANSMVILSRGIPGVMVAFSWKGFLNDSGCKLVFYVHRVGRGVSISSTCLLSIFQAITISPRNSRWAELKMKAPKSMEGSIFLCWILHMLVNITVPMNIISKWSNKNITKKKDFIYCSAVFFGKNTGSLHAALLLFPDIVSLGLILWSSGSMVFILYRHKQRVQHIHRNKIYPRSSPETRATQTIVVLVSTFVSFYTLSSIFQVFASVFYDHTSWWLVNTGALTAACFPTVSPFILMSRDSSVFRLCFAWVRKTKLSRLIRNT